jgi:cytochrome c-type biogenesis protein CcmF
MTKSLLGTIAIVGGLGSSVAGVLTLALGLADRRYRAFLRLGPAYAWGVLGGALAAFAVMEWALITRDFSVDYVTQVGSHRTPALFNFASLWSALEGSLLLWLLILGGFTVLVARHFAARVTDPLVAWAMIVMFAVSIFFFSLLLFTGNPFDYVTVPDGFDGPGPNPLLQNHVLMAFHPPILYLGYVGFTVPFAFATAALVTGRLGEGWLLETRRWTMIAWGCLTTGILLGAWWSYEVLGWGGYWAWDPVENASLLPWLTGTAYLHSVMVQERRGMLRVWNLSLVCATFSLTILGTFLTRSGVVESVHAFSEGSVGPWLLAFFGLIVAVTLGLIAWRGDRLRSPGSIDSPFSREGGFLANNVLFAGFAFVVLLGTVFPLVIEVLRGEQLSVGRPYFDRMTLPIGLALLFMMAVAPILPWRKASGELLSQRLFWPGWIGTGTVAAAVLLGARGFAPLVAFGLAGFAGGAALRQVALATRRQGWRGLVGRTNGGMIVHLGVVLVAVALAASSSYATERELVMEIGDEAVVAGHTIELVGVEDEQADLRAELAAELDPDGVLAETDPDELEEDISLALEEELGDRSTLSTRAEVLVDGRSHTPSIERFLVAGQQLGSPSVQTGPTRDVYLTLARLPEDAGEVGAGVSGEQGDAVIRVIIQPMMVWMWIGGGVMGLGTLLAVFPGRRRDPLRPVSAPLPGGRRRGGDGDEGGDEGGDGTDATPDASTPAEPVRLGALEDAIGEEDEAEVVRS